MSNNNNNNDTYVDVYGPELTVGQSIALANARYELADQGVISLDTMLSLITEGIDAASDTFAPTFLNGEN